MNKQKKSSYGGLVYRELYLGRRTYTGILCIYLGLIAIFVVIFLSLQKGLLAQQQPDDLAFIKGFARYFAILTPTMVFSLSATTLLDMSKDDLNDRWLQFFYSSPVSEAKFFGVKYVILGLVAVIGMVISVLNGLVISHLSGHTFVYRDFALIVAIVCTVTAGVIFYYTVGLFLQNSVLSLMISLATGGILFKLLCGDSLDNLFVTVEYEDGTIAGELNMAAIQEIADGITAWMPVFPVILVVALVVGWFLCTAILKNRERRSPFERFIPKKWRKQGGDRHGRIVI